MAAAALAARVPQEAVVPVPALLLVGVVLLVLLVLRALLRHPREREPVVRLQPLVPAHLVPGEDVPVERRPNRQSF